ncbi:hypothetical protein I7I50_10353 [Histoplasma capsulatum G186AR]|uniref:Uncharacterized protein n=1 Tax=Ajellomyces capsulatus TaxID=5037 RepID=A0A8H7Z481_AJECA|nr:hypothetical protein I7I52_01592 [Histoplasma capsulatum]QSS69159.1 hypothetical protein I7I50_10353 [Histoplasma capsulatum G186AR]
MRGVPDSSLTASTLSRLHLIAAGQFRIFLCSLAYLQSFCQRNKSSCSCLPPTKSLRAICAVHLPVPIYITVLCRAEPCYPSWLKIYFPQFLFCMISLYSLPVIAGPNRPIYPDLRYSFVD